MPSIHNVSFHTISSAGNFSFTIKNRFSQSQIETIYGYKPNERLFPTTKSSLYRAMKKYSELAGVKKIRIHDLRHSHASLLIEKGVPPLAISERLGHEDIQTTLNTYSHLYPNKQNEIADMLSSLMV